MCYNATPFLWAFGHFILAWLWLDQALAAVPLVPKGGSEEVFARGKLRACRYFFECELPRSETWLKFVASSSDVAADAPSAIF